MTKEQLAEKMNGGEYRTVPTDEHVALAKQHGLLIVHGASDDLCEFDGAFTDEVGCYEGGTISIDKDGVIPSWDGLDKDALHRVRAWIARYDKKGDIIAVWDEDGYSWSYKTDLPHATFDILEDGKPYCRGLVIDIKDIG